MLPKTREKPSMKHFLSIILCTVMTTAQQAWARDIRTERVQFERGANSTVVESSIKGYETVDYVLRAGKGQHMNVSMATNNGGNCESDLNLIRVGDEHYEIPDAVMGGENDYPSSQKSGFEDKREHQSGSLQRLG